MSSVWIAPHLHALSSFLDLSQVWPPAILWSVSSRWQLAFLSSRNYSPLSPGTVGMAALEGGQPVPTCASRVEPDRPFPAGQGRGQEGQQGTRRCKAKQTGRGAQQLPATPAAPATVTSHGEARPAFRGALLVGGLAAIDAFVLFCDSFNKQRAAAWS